MKVLTTIDLLALPSLETPPAGHVGFGAKADGLYQKIGTTETKLSVDGHTHTFASLTSKPTTLAGYGITDAANISHNHAGVYEPAFTKNTAFNKNFGTAAGTVSEGNHTHTFASLTSKPTTLAGYGITDAANINHTHNYLNVPDTRSVVSVPQNLISHAFQVEFKSNSSVGNPPISANALYSHILSVAGWASFEGSGGWPSQVSFGDGIAIRQAIDATTWGVWRTLWHSGNFTNLNQLPTRNFSDLQNRPTTLSGYGITDAPTKTGIGASGTWGIDITGNAATASKLQTARNIAGVSFDGTADIAIPFANLSSKPTTLSGYGITDFTSHNNGNPINPANTTVNAIGYANSVSLFGQIDGGLINTAYSSTWQSQIFQDFRTGQIALRGKNNGAWTSWRTVWDNSNFTNLNQLTTRNFSDLQNKPTTLSGYGIIDAVTTNTTQTVSGAKTFSAALTASVSVTTPKVIFAAAGWSVEQTGTEIQFKYNGVIKQRLLSDGSIVAVGEVTAYGATS